MKINDAGFQDFRQDASCLIRPQSLLGEKYVDCDPTQPRAPGTEPPPPLDEIPDGQPGAGQHFLPLENNGQEVDLDLVNNIMRQPYADRFRLILNELGAGLAARGKTLTRSSSGPTRRCARRPGARRARQPEPAALQARRRLRHDPAPLARERQHLAGFINNANTAAEATAERSHDLEAGFQKFPAALHELRLTMAKLRGFSDQATPVFAEFRAGAPAIARATEALGPFAHAAKPALTTLGTAAAQSKQPLVNSDPPLRRSATWPRRPPRAPNRLGQPARQPAQDRRLQVPDEVPVQHHRRGQRLRPVRALPPRRLLFPRPARSCAGRSIAATGHSRTRPSSKRTRRANSSGKRRASPRPARSIRRDAGPPPAPTRHWRLGRLRWAPSARPTA